jgi:hypothetical protein
MENKTIEQGVDQIYGESNDPVNVRKKVAFIQGAKWMREQQESKIDSHIKWCEENIENLTIRNSPVQTAINIHPYQQFIRLLKQLK